MPLIDNQKGIISTQLRRSFMLSKTHGSNSSGSQ